MLCDPHVIASFQNVLYPIIALAEAQTNRHWCFFSFALLFYYACDRKQFTFIPVAILLGTLESCLNNLITIKVQVRTDCSNSSLRLFYHQSDNSNYSNWYRLRIFHFLTRS